MRLFVMCFLPIHVKSEGGLLLIHSSQADSNPMAVGAVLVWVFDFSIHMKTLMMAFAFPAALGDLGHVRTGTP